MSRYHKTGILPRAHTSTHPYEAGNDAIILLLLKRRVVQSIILCVKLCVTLRFKKREKSQKTCKTPKTGSPGEFPPCSRNDRAVFIL